MSHTVKIQTQFKSMRALKKAFEGLNWNLKQNSRLRSYNGNDSRVYPEVAVNPSTESNAYDLAVIQNENEIEILGDLYGGSVAQTLGHGLGTLKQNYAVSVLDDELSSLGYNISTEKLPNGYITLEAEKA